MLENFNPETLMQGLKKPSLLKVPLCANPENDDYIGIPAIIPFSVEAENSYVSILKQGDKSYTINIPAGELIDIINNL